MTRVVGVGDAFVPDAPVLVAVCELLPLCVREPAPLPVVLVNSLLIDEKILSMLAVLMSSVEIPVNPAF